MTTLTPDSAIAAIERALAEVSQAKNSVQTMGALTTLRSAANPAALRLLLAALREAQEDADRWKRWRPWIERRCGDLMAYEAARTQEN